MECSCLRYTDLPNTTRLFADFAYHFDRVSRFYGYSPHGMGSYKAAAGAVSLTDERRAALISALRVQNPESESLALLARPGTVAVVTGQQVGLFSGPAYTIYKALTAVKLARELTAQGTPAVPVFWLATEDHDFAEINHCWTLSANSRPVKIEADGPLSSAQPVGGILLAAPPVGRLRETLEGLPFGEEIAGLAAQSYTPGATFGGAFRALLEGLLPGYGLLYVDPMLPVFRELAAPALRRALAIAPELTAKIKQRNAELDATGYHAQVHVEDTTSLVFLIEQGRRIALRRHDGDYLSTGRKFSAAELAERAHELSPNALLRPVVQDSMLPTAAYVGGPAELAYLAQSEPVYQAILGRMPVVLHRSGFTLVDARSLKLLARYGLQPQDCFSGGDALRERIAATLVPPAMASAMNQAKAATEKSLDALAASMNGFDSSLLATLQKSRRKMTYQLAKMERKIGRESLARERRSADDAQWLEALLYPEKHLQERLYTILPFLARHGLDLIGRVYEHIRLDCPDHQLLEV